MYRWPHSLTLLNWWDAPAWYWVSFLWEKNEQAEENRGNTGFHFLVLRHSKQVASMRKSSHVCMSVSLCNFISCTIVLWVEAVCFQHLTILEYQEYLQAWLQTALGQLLLLIIILNFFCRWIVNQHGCTCYKNFHVCSQLHRCFFLLFWLVSQKAHRCK